MTSSHPKLAALAAITLIFSLLCCSANACTAIYVGSALTDDGATVLARSEDIANSYNKLYFVNPHGAHKMCIRDRNDTDWKCIRNRSKAK